MLKVKRNEENPETDEILAEAIVRLGKGVKKLQENGLNEKAIIVLLKDSTKLSSKQIKKILDSLANLESWYCREEKDE